MINWNGYVGILTKFSPLALVEIFNKITTFHFQCTISIPCWNGDCYVRETWHIIIMTTQWVSWRFKSSATQWIQPFSTVCALSTLARGIHIAPVDLLHKGSVTGKAFSWRYVSCMLVWHSTELLKWCDISLAKSLDLLKWPNFRFCVYVWNIYLIVYFWFYGVGSTILFSKYVYSDMPADDEYNTNNETMLNIKIRSITTLDENPLASFIVKTIYTKSSMTAWRK